MVVVAVVVAPAVVVAAVCVCIFITVVGASVVREAAAEVAWYNVK